MQHLEFYIHRRTARDDSRSGTIAFGPVRLELTLPPGATVVQNGQELVVALPDSTADELTLIHLHEEELA